MVVQVEIVDLKSEKGEQAVQKILSNCPVILIGSGVSMWQPTDLLTGNEFVDQLFDLIFPESFLNDDPRTKPIVEENFKGCYHKDLPGFPFEVLFEGCPRKEKITPIFKNIFSTEKFNPIHEALAEHFLSGGFSAVITTNYDLCLDSLFGFTDTAEVSDIARIVTQDDFDSDKITERRIYFKIHGSADDMRGETLVFALSQESRLPKWKRELLYKIFEQHPVLLILGYSGSDFEICPELSAMPVELIFWNTRSDKISLNARRLSEYKKVQFLKGDMRNLLSSITGTDIKAEKGKSDELFRSIESQFTPQDLIEWRAFLLYRMGFTLLALRACDELEGMPMDTSDKISTKRLKTLVLFHLGKYKTSADLASELAAMAETSPVMQTDLLINASAAYRCYGEFNKSARYMNMAKKVVEKVDGKEKMRLLARMHMHQAGTMLYIYRFWKIMDTLTIGLTKKKSENMKKEIDSEFRKACKYALESGSWFDFQEAALWAQQVGIEISELTKGMEYPPPHTPREGYKFLASIVPQMIEARSKFNRKGHLNLKEKKELENYLQLGKVIGNNPEVWKLLLIKIKRSKLSTESINDLAEFLRFYKLCEYSLLFRILFPLVHFLT
jgi:hypothetical protein